MSMTHDQNTPESDREGRRQRLLAFFILFVIAGGVYFNSIPSSFVLDDKAAVQEHPGAQWPLDLKAIFTSNYWGDRENYEELTIYRPLATLTFALTDGLGADECPGCHRTVNILLFVLCVFWVYLLGLALLRNEKIAFLIAVLFAVHPIHTEAVVGIVSRAELLAAWLVMAGTHLYVKRVRRFDRAPGLAVIGVVALYALALLSKENGVSFWGVLLGFHFVDAVGQWRQGRLLREISWHPWMHLGMLGTLAGYFALRSAVLPHMLRGAVPFADNPMVGGDWLVRWGTPFKVFAGYLKLLVIPWPLTVDYSYDHFQVAQSLGDVQLWLGIALFVGIVALAFWSIGRFPHLAAGILGFFATYMVVSHVFFLSTIIFAERLMFLPSAFFLLALAVVIDVVWEHEKSVWVRRLVPWAAGALVLLFAGATIERNADWETPLSLYESAVHVAPGSARSQHLYANALFDDGQVEASIPHYRNALAINPSNFVARSNFARTLLVTKSYEDAVKHASIALQFKRRYPTARLIRASALANLGRFSEAVPDLKLYLNKRPDNPRARGSYAYSLAEIGEFEAALSQLEWLIRNQRDYRPPLPLVCRIYWAIGKPQSVGPICREKGLPGQ